MGTDNTFGETNFNPDIAEMTDYARLTVTGKSRAELREDIAKLKAWGGDLPVYVKAGTIEVLDAIDNVEKAVNGDLAKYIEEKFGSKFMIVKSGGHDDLYLVPDYDMLGVDNKFRKIRHKATNFTPKKKRRNRR
jgi:hypothetical protein